jgi:hypothetical protein
MPISNYEIEPKKCNQATTSQDQPTLRNEVITCRTSLEKN